MTTLRISEAISAQSPMVAHADEIGWTPLTPEDAEAKRGGTTGMYLPHELESKLIEFNPWLSESAARAIVDTVEAQPSTIEGNREVLAWLRGERQAYDENEKRHRSVQLIDYEHPENNTCNVTWEWKIVPVARKGNRADVIFLVNGVPVAIVEHKNPKDGGALERAIKQLRRYEKETPELLAAPQLFNVTHLLDYWYGVTWSANRRGIARWKQAPEESYRLAVQAFFEPHDFLRTLRDWILFYVEDGKRRSRFCASTSAALSTGSSRVVRTQRRRGDSSGIRRARARPSRYSRPHASSWRRRIASGTARSSSWLIEPSWRVSSRGGSTDSSARCSSRTLPCVGLTARMISSSCSTPTSAGSCSP